MHIRCLGVLALVVASYAVAEVPRRSSTFESAFQNWTIVHNFVPSVFISHDIAQKTGLKRHPEVYNLILAVLAHNSAGETAYGTMHPAGISAHLVDLIGHRQQVEFVTIPEGAGAYHLYQYRREEGTRTAHIKVRPHGAADLLELQLLLQ